MSPVLPSRIAPGWRTNSSHTERSLPSSRLAPSIWYAEVEAPHRKSAAKGVFAGEVGAVCCCACCCCGGVPDWPAGSEAIAIADAEPARNSRRVSGLADSSDELPEFSGEFSLSLRAMAVQPYSC